MAGGEQPNLPEDQTQTEYAWKTARESETNIKKGADGFVDKMDKLAASEAQLTSPKTDIGKLAEDAKAAIDAEIAAKPLRTKNNTLSDKWLEAGPMKIIADARESAFKRIDGAKETCENKKKLITEATEVASKGIEASNDGRKKIEAGTAALTNLFNLDSPGHPVTDAQLIKAKSDLTTVTSDRKHIDSTVIPNMMAARDDLITRPEFKTLAVAQLGVEKLGRYTTHMIANNVNFSIMINNGENFFRALQDNAKANGLSNKDPKAASALAKKAKSAKEVAIKDRDGLKNLQFPPDDVYVTPEDPKYSPQRVQEDNLQKQGDPLPNIDQSDADKVGRLSPGSETIIKVGNKEVLISRNEDGDYELPDGHIFPDRNVALFEAKKMAWTENHEKNTPKPGTPDVVAMN